MDTDTCEQCNYHKIKTSMSFEVFGPSRAKGDNRKLESDWRGASHALYFHHKS